MKEMTVVVQIYEKGYLSVEIFSPMNYYITSSVMPNFLSTNPKILAGLVVVRNALRCKLPPVKCVIGWRMKLSCSPFTMLKGKWQEYLMKK